ncbi:MAG TPA: phosphate ABC transporter substrate-binding protein PstS [Thermoleophilia bacterium]|nr:phosphate ABC transporter substrate-binding protein PstS [Thermoleophilia bacterium]
MKMFRHVLIAGAVVGLVSVAAACGSSSTSTVTVTSGGSSGGGSSNVLNGAGSTLVAPLMSQWIGAFAKLPAATTVTYGAVGSGGGVDAITARTVDFGASDAPLSPAQATACKGCLQIPWALGATVVTYHATGVPNNLRLTGQVVAEIFMGKITSWSDPAIAKLNPGVHLPSTHISVIYRSDGSGDSYVFSSYLSAVDPAWKSSIGASTQPSFPTGSGDKGNSGVAAAVQATNGAISYVGISYIAADSLDQALIQNAAGKYPAPGVASIGAAAKAITTFNPDGSITLVNPPASAAGAYPLSTYTYAIVPTKSPKAATLKAFLKYAISSTGQAFGPPLGFPPLPAAVVAHDQAEIAKIHS